MFPGGVSVRGFEDRKGALAELREIDRKGRRIRRGTHTPLLVGREIKREGGDGRGHAAFSRERRPFPFHLFLISRLFFWLKYPTTLSKLKTSIYWCIDITSAIIGRNISIV